MAAQIRTDGLVDAQRLRQALGLLREAGPAGITKLQLARKMGGVSLRTVDRAIKLLEEQGARLGKSRASRPAVIHFSLEKGPGWDEHLSSETRLALRLASLSLSHNGTQHWEGKLQALESLTSPRMSSKDRSVFGQLQKALRVQGGAADSVETPEVLEPILRSLEGPRELELEYHSAATKKGSALTVVPFALTHDLFSGGAFLLAWDPKHKLPLHLRLGCIQKAKALTRSGLIPDPLLMARATAFQIGGWTSTEEAFTVRARLEGAHWVQSLKEAPPALPDFACQVARNGESAELTFRANHGAGASRWLLQFGEAVEVLEPAWLRKEIAGRLSAAAAKYRGKK